MYIIKLPLYNISVKAVTILSDNLRKYIETNNLSLRDFGKELGLSHSAISRILNSQNPEKLQPKTKRLIANGLGFDFDELCTKELSLLVKMNKNSYKIPFYTISGENTSNTIESHEKYQFAVNIQTNDYAPLFPLGTILFFDTQSAYQKDICILKFNKTRILCLVVESYRNVIVAKDLTTGKKFETPRTNLVAVLMKSLHH